MADFNGFVGAARRLDDIDLPRMGHEIGVGEDELHAVIDVESRGKGFDSKGRPLILYEPHVAWRCATSREKRDALARAGLAYPKWGEKPYPKDSYARLLKAMQIDETSALKACSWGMFQVLGENAQSLGWPSVQAFVRDMMEDEENHLKAAIQFIKVNNLDDELRALAALTRPTTAADCAPFVRVWNGPGYAKNKYHTKMAAAHNKWRKIKDTAWAPEGMQGSGDLSPATVPVPKTDPAPVPIAGQSGPVDLVRAVQQLLRDKGYPEVGNVDGKMGSRTRNAILAFQADNALPLTGEISDSLLADLVKAQRRGVSEERATATAKDLKDATSVKQADMLKKVGMGVLVSSGVGGLLDGTGDIDKAITGIAKIRSLTDAILSLSPWLLGAAAGGIAIYVGSRFIREQVEAYREGRHV